MNQSLLRFVSICALSLVAACSNEETPSFDDTEADTGLPLAADAADAADAATTSDAVTTSDAAMSDGDAPASETEDAPASETTDAIPSETGDAALPCDAPVRCYVDADGDGYAKNEGSMLACTCPPGYRDVAPTSATVDCNDDNPNVHPGVTTFSETPYCVGAGCATKSFDYDCSGSEEKKDATVFTACSSFLSGCTGAGWAGAAPACGAAADYTTCATGVAVCTTSNASKKQACR